MNERLGLTPDLRKTDKVTLGFGSTENPWPKQNRTALFTFVGLEDCIGEFFET